MQSQEKHFTWVGKNDLKVLRSNNEYENTLFSNYKSMASTPKTVPKGSLLSNNFGSKLR